MATAASENRLAAYRLRPYQREVAAAILDSALNNRGLTFSVEIARQGGKNELSAQLETLLLTLFMSRQGNLIKCSPTFKPQSMISMRRLQDRLNDAGFTKIWKPELGYIVRLGYARAVFLSADESANVVGNTADILLEIDESQDVSRDKYDKDFRPMCSTTNATTVHYGTTWDETTLLEEVKQANLELERNDGVRRHFRYDWEEVARYVPEYRTYVEAERERLGENHPLFLTQYRLLPVHGGGGFLDAQQRALMQGEHPRQRQRTPGKIYVAGIDIAGEVEETEGDYEKAAASKHDATVVTIAELDFSQADEVVMEPVIRVVEHYRWTGIKHARLYRALINITGEIWKCRKIVVDATGVGEPVASLLGKAIGKRVVPFKFTQPSKSELGFNLLAVVNAGRLMMYRQDGSEEYREFWHEMEKAKSRYRANRTMNFYVDPSQGHDDFLMSLVLAVEAAGLYKRRGAKGNES
jgi:hypothetical protein